MNYPQQHEELLRKAGLIGTGKLEVRAIHRNREHTVSKDGGVTYEKERRPESSKRLSTSTSLLKNSAGNIAGYWANGLTAEEKRIINEECGVPFFNLGNPAVGADGKFLYPDTRLQVLEGHVYDLSVPADVATVLVLKEIASTIGMDMRDAMMHGADLYFYSQEEEEQENAKVRIMRKSAAKLIEDLSTKEKHKVVRILILQDELIADQFLSQDAARDIFDDVAFTMPTQVLKANEIADKQQFIVSMTLVKAGYIEADSKDGPYYKNESVFGSRVHLADSLSELIKNISKYPDLVKEYDKLNGAVTGVYEDSSSIPMSPVSNMLSRHGLGGKGTTMVAEDLTGARKAIKAKVQMWKLEQVLAALDNEEIDHEFDTNSDIKEVKAFYVEKHVD
jgi:hypothetical protein